MILVVGLPWRQTAFKFWTRIRMLIVVKLLIGAWLKKQNMGRETFDGGGCNYQRPASEHDWLIKENGRVWYICLFVLMYPYMCVCICIGVHKCMCEYMRVHMHVHMCMPWSYPVPPYPALPHHRLCLCICAYKRVYDCLERIVLWITCMKDHFEFSESYSKC